MKITLAQLNFTVGAIEKNADAIIKTANHADGDLIVFPELSLCGYPPEDLLFRDEFFARCQAALEKIKQHVKKTIVIGYPEKIHQKIFNKACVIHNGKIIADYAKQELPNYTVFDEKRYFKPGDESCIFELDHIQFGLVICEDVWHADPIQKAKKAGAQIIIAINASPYDTKQIEKREHVLQKRITENHLPIVYVNCVGGQDEIVFDGGSMVLDYDGKKILQAPFYEESIVSFNIAKQDKKITLASSCHSKPLPLLEQVYKTLTLGLRDYVLKNHFEGALLGLSGGIDSALTLAIAVDALGRENVTAVIMPSEFTAKISVDDAVAEACKLGVPYHIIKIDEIKKSFLTELSCVFENTKTDTTEENIQARIRGMLLMAMSNKFGKIVLTTGNRSEMAVGYATLYGDMAGGFAVLKNVPKMMVYELSHYRNKMNAVIPERVITRAPSAELKPDQTDQDTLPPYPILDEIIAKYIDEDKSAADIIAMGFEKPVVEKIIRMINTSEYKRKQSAVGVRLNSRSFGKDRRYPTSLV